MIAAVQYGSNPPLWVAVLMAAQEWGTPPWEIAQGGSRLLWFRRWAFWTSQRNQAMNRVHDG